MTSDSDLHPTLQPDYHIAERVRMQLEVFPRKFRQLNEGGQLSTILRRTQTLPGARVEQAPEVFTEQYLIEPVLNGLGYRNPASEQYTGDGPHFIRQPLTYDKVEPLQPDYLLKEIAPEVVCIVEAKAANREQMCGAKQKATEDIRTYIEEDTFCKYLRDMEQRYLVGIGTDGLRWTLWLKDLGTGETKSGVPKVDLTPIIEQEAIRLDTIDGEVADGRNAARNLLLDEFVPAFAVDNLLDHVKTEFSG
ncbi:hypothetical protein [Haloarcula halophila]|uniref:hypothetical protein n=1 Tax=Haloarcula TaxID=2237 RepID=UPI0023E470F1|nr:hypothetical protein [Halomicroarcula sp. DFY41]